MSHTSVEKSSVLQEIFLSPRVIDREAFNDYSGSLRRLIEEAEAKTTALKAATAEALAAQAALREASTRYQARMESMTRTLQEATARLTATGGGPGVL